MARIDDLFLKSVYYLYPSHQDAEESSEQGACGFFFGVVSDSNPNYGYVYAVTNRHVILGLGRRNPILRINTYDNSFEIIETHIDDWILHPDGNDLAIWCFDPCDFTKHDITFVHSEHLVTEDFIDEWNIGPGDEVFMVGRFRVAAGKTTNLPTTRFGTIAQMPIEKLHNPFSKLDEESYLVEMRSTSGFSGSPVILHIPPLSKRYKGNQGRENFSQKSYNKLLGIEWGHIHARIQIKDENNNPHPDQMFFNLDTAMAGVVPASKLHDLIFSEELIEIRKKFDKEIMELE